MNFFTIGAILVGLSALFGYLNHRYLRLPHTIGLLVISLAASLVVIAIDLLLPFSQMAEFTTAWLQQIDFNKTLMHGMLSFLLFAGGLHADFSAFQTRRTTIAVLAFVAVIAAPPGHADHVSGARRLADPRAGSRRGSRRSTGSGWPGVRGGGRRTPA